jgi:hypothetical protein
MFMTRETHLVVFRDLDKARDAVLGAVAEGNTEEIPGLQRALRILDDLAADTVDPPVRWVLKVLEKEGIDPCTHALPAVRCLRQALPGLGLANAVGLVKRAKQAMDDQTQP